MDNGNVGRGIIKQKKHANVYIGLKGGGDTGVLIFVQ